jgi:hypothetical protein
MVVMCRSSHARYHVQVWCMSIQSPLSLVSVGVFRGSFRYLEYITECVFYG